MDERGETRPRLPAERKNELAVKARPDNVKVRKYEAVKVKCEAKRMRDEEERTTRPIIGHVLALLLISKAKRMNKRVSTNQRVVT